MQEYSDVAILGSKKNLDGRLVVNALPGLPFLLHEGMQVHFVPPKIDVPRSALVTAVSMQSEDTAIVTFDAVDSADYAEALVGCHVLVAKDDLSEYFSQDYLEFMEADPFIGWTLEDSETDFAGTIESVDSSAGQILCEVIAENGDSHLIPLADELVISIDEDAHTIVLNCPKGIFDL